MFLLDRIFDRFGTILAPKNDGCFRPGNLQNRAASLSEPRGGPGDPILALRCPFWDHFDGFWDLFGQLLDRFWEPGHHFGPQFGSQDGTETENGHRRASLRTQRAVTGHRPRVYMCICISLSIPVCLCMCRDVYSCLYVARLTFVPRRQRRQFASGSLHSRSGVHGM